MPKWALRWHEQPSVRRAVCTFEDVLGFTTTVVGDLRRAINRDGEEQLRFVLGRQDRKSPVGVGRHGFYTDIPYLIFVLLELYAAGIEVANELEGCERTIDERNQWVRILERIESLIPRFDVTADLD